MWNEENPHANSTGFIMQCKGRGVLCCKCIENHWPDILSANYEFKLIFVHILNTFFNQLTGAKRQYWYFK
jgi:hypothetical protein